jgi:hypothetical protein
MLGKAVIIIGSILGLARTVFLICAVNGRMFGDFPAKNTEHAPYTYGYG